MFPTVRLLSLKLLIIDEVRQGCLLIICKLALVSIAFSTFVTTVIPQFHLHWQLVYQTSLTPDAHAKETAAQRKNPPSKKKKMGIP